MKKETRVPGESDRDEPSNQSLSRAVDQGIDRLLKAALRVSGTEREAAADQICVDAETLAAWSAGALSQDDAATVESHLSSCARCQAMMAVCARIEPALPPLLPFWRRWSIGWMIPLAAAVAAVLIWIALPKPAPSAIPAGAIARVEPASATQAQSTAPAPPAAARVEPPVLHAAVPDRFAKSIAAEPAAPPKSQPEVVGRVGATTGQGHGFSNAPRDANSTPVAPKASPTTPAPVAQPPATVVTGQPAAVTTAATRSAPPPPQPAPPPPAQPVAAPMPPPPPPVREPVESPRAAGAASSSTSLSAGRPGRAAATESMVADRLSAVAIEIVAPDLSARAAPAAGGGGGGGRGGGGAAGGGRGGRGAAGPPTRWRILSAGSVERSTNGGASWEPIAIDPPAQLTGGVAMSNAVCWLIGRGGVVLLATDGVHFEHKKFPESVDLASIRATNARQATVTTVDGRVYETTDAGQTWRLQGFPPSPF